MHNVEKWSNIMHETIEYGNMKLWLTSLDEVWCEGASKFYNNFSFKYNAQKNSLWCYVQLNLILKITFRYKYICA